MLESKWGTSRGARFSDDDKKVKKVKNTGLNQPQKAEVKADSSGDTNQIVKAKGSALVLPIQFAPRVSVAFPAVNVGVQTPVLSTSGDIDSEEESDKHHC
ncbi:MAG: hypothetical protein ACQEXB_15260 [Bacillota bacterium]